MKRILKHALWIVPSLLVVAIVAMGLYTANARATEDEYHASLTKSVQVSSDSFQNGQEMPVRISCSGAGISPEIKWTGGPADARSYVLLATDWDAPSPNLRLFSVAHWVVYNIPNSVTEIPENASVDDLNRREIVVGKNMIGAARFAAPCPPLGSHQYLFRVYALDVDRIQPANDNKAGVMAAMNGHILGYGELIGVRSPG
jgi:Raf kinase inhibitor-like YbhB/YbcL family protein